jgi:hypothetical protein
MDTIGMIIQHGGSFSNTGNLNTGPLPIPMGQQTQVLNQIVGGALCGIAINLYGSLDLANSILNIQFLRGINQNFQVNLSFSELDLFGDYTVGTQPQMAKFSDVDRAYSMIWYPTPESSLAGIDQVIINVTTPSPTLDPQVPIGFYTVVITYYNALQRLFDSYPNETTPSVQKITDVLKLF